ncbi:MAG: prepilin peptidase [Proteobacteria bacterium]|nr:prepilin peptidase [Pseudomonadota bacterium]
MIELLATSPAAFIGTALVLGLVVGSFLNVVIHRLPIMLQRQWQQQGADLAATDSAAPTLPALPVVPAEKFNLVVPRSACPACKAPITALQNIPLLSWLFLRGRCASCRAPISVRYPLVELLTGLTTGAVAWRFGVGWPAFAAMALTWSLVALTFIDLDTQLLPDDITLPLLWAGMLMNMLLAPAAGAASLPVGLGASVIGAMAGYVSLWSVYHLFRLLTGKEGMGYGDFKLFAALGAWLGWQMLLPVILFAAAVGAVTGLGLILARGRDRSTPIPFGPFLAAGGWLMLMYGPQIVAGYFGLYALHR